jgi:hypothetical protein
MAAATSRARASSLRTLKAAAPAKMPEDARHVDALARQARPKHWEYRDAQKIRAAEAALAKK